MLERRLKFFDMLDTRVNHERDEQEVIIRDE